ncbi:Hsp20/alpha crystallin family protein [Halobium salinum]|uniref:Hsp20/alpha crystallin family protein n=1 Tax=Halobium salinum TaxID=1364940 RepID=A0ABD5P8A5_9EURY|nr:Hsp20/alpha crystallin family protein [Halobium salinum]
MSLQQFANPDERFLRRYEYDDQWVVAGDLGVADDRVDVDVVGSTAIVVVEREDEAEAEFEFELPGAEAEVLMRNGVLTITGSR